MKIIIAAAFALTASTVIAQEAASFPNADRAWLSEGLFVAPETTRLVKPGLTKSQIRALLGPPHFGESFFSRRWNYVLNFYGNDGAGPDHVTCQLRLDYAGGTVGTITWKDPACADRIAYKPPTVTAAAMPPATAAKPVDTVVRELTVLFPNNSAALTPAARQVIAEAVALTRSNPVRKTIVVGSTDRIGSSNYNLVLSGQRAKAVAASLTEAGVVLADTTVAQNGEDSLAVPTAQGVGNAANRRVVITLIE